MKRVVILSKFKSFIKRLFGEADDLTENQEVAKQIDEKNEMNPEPRSKPAFRFPIITDAEIYGWDEPTKEKEYVETAPLSESQNTKYEPTPLHDNERFPKDDKPINIYRAGKAPKFKTETEPNERVLRARSTEDKAISAEKSLPPIERKVQKKSNKRFIPTNVPSPVHGFSSAKNSDLAKKKLLSKEEVYRDETIDTGTSNPDLFGQFELDEQVESSIAVPELIKESEIVLKTIEQIQSALEDEIAAQEPVALEVEIAAQEPVALEDEIAAQELVVLEDEIEAQEVMVFEEEIIESELTRKEKIVPFNVLMLKSDKQKLAFARQKKVEKPVLNDKENIASVNIETNLVEETNLMTQPVIGEPVTNSSLENDIIEVEQHYVFPSIDLLIPPETQIEDTEWLDSQSERLEESLSHFGIQATVIEAMQGPTVTRFELTVGQGTKVSRVRNLTDDLKLTLAAEDIRIQAPIPGRSSIGIEIPNRTTRPVRISEVIGTEEFSSSESPLEAVLGLSLTGKPVTLDLRKMPHGMIAGATGSGKSVCINSILVSLLYKATPTDLKMMLIDPKMVELAPFNGIPHLISPVITDVKAATAALKWAVGEMERRYELLAHAGVRDIERYNKAAIESRSFSKKMPYLLIVIDELSDLMMMAPADVEISISRIAQKARACGIHLIIATQRPSVDVITGTIKANIPTRISFAVSSQVDSRTIIDTAGADRLLGKGDMLYIGNGQSSPVRLQGTFVTDNEIERIINHVQREASPIYLFGQDELLKSAVEDEETDPLFEDACLFIFEQGSASTSLLQRNFSIGYNRAAKLMDSIEKRGFISEQRGSRARDVLLTESDLEQIRESIF